MTKEEIIEQLENTILLIMQNGKDYMDERDIPLLKIVIQILKQKPCKDTISRQAVLEIQAKYAENVGATKFWQMRDDIKSLPSVTPQSKMGKWIDTDNYYQRWKCSECGCHTRDAEPNFCPNCGCRMEEGE